MERHVKVRILVAFWLLLAVYLGCMGERLHAQDASLTALQRQAIVRIQVGDGGLSGTIIKSQDRMTWILSAAHGWIEGGDRRQSPFSIDVPSYDGKPLPPSYGKPRLIGLDAQADLALIELPAGPFPVIQVAPVGQKYGRQAISAGYDRLKWQDGPLVRTATILSDDGQMLYTDKIPWMGRSGGPLIDPQSGTLIGVVHGFSVMGPSSQGIYVDTRQVQKFMAKYLSDGTQSPPAADNDGWTYDPRSGGWYRGGLSPGVAAKEPGRVRIVEEPPGLGGFSCPNGQCQRR